MILAISFLAVFVLVLSGGLLLFHRGAALGRLQTIVEGSELSRRRPRDRRLYSVEEILKPFQNVVPRTEQEVSVIVKRLTRAGYRKPSAVNFFYAAKVLVPLFLAGGATLTGVYRLGPFFVYALALGLGFLLPDFWLGNRIANRKWKIRLGLPEALDLMVICTEAGLGLDQAMVRVAQELKASQPEIQDELTLVNLEQKAGLPRDEALKHLGERVDIDAVRALSTTLIQADTYGTSIAKTLRVYSDSLRTQRRQQAEEQAAKTTVKLVFPLVFCIFPSIFVVALGPAAISLWEGLDKFF